MFVTIACILLFGFLLLSKGVDDASSQNSEGHELEKHVMPREEAAIQNELSDEQLKRPVYEKPLLNSNALGEFGRAVNLNLDGDEKNLEEESINKHQINIYLSERISLHRRLAERWNPL